jgi:hypothetical protein
VVVCLFAYLRPMLTRIDTVSYVALGVLAVASEVAAAAGDATTSNGFAVTALSLQFALVLVGLCVEAVWRTTVVTEHRGDVNGTLTTQCPVVATEAEVSTKENKKEGTKRVLPLTVSRSASERHAVASAPVRRQAEQLEKLISLAASHGRRSHQVL